MQFATRNQELQRLLILERAESEALHVRTKAELELVNARHLAALTEQRAELDERREQAAEGPHERERRRPGLW